MKTTTIKDRGILFQAFLALTNRTAGTHIGTITAFSPSPAQTEYQKMDENGDLTAFESDNGIDNISLTMQFKTGAKEPEVNEEILLVPTTQFDRQYMGIYKVVSKPVPTQAQNGVRTVAISARRAMNGTNRQTAVPVQPALIYVESGTAGSGTYSYKLRNVGGAIAASGSDYMIINPDRLVAVTGFTFPAVFDTDDFLFTPAADLDPAESVDVSLTPVTP